MKNAAAAARPPAMPLTLSLTRGALRMLSRTAPGAASAVAVDLFTNPRKHRTPDRERELLAGATPFHVRIGYKARVKAWRWGTDGPAVLLAHGWEGRGSQLAAFARPLADAGFTVVTFDAPAHGESDGARSSLPHFTWALRKVAEDVGRVHAIIAHSLGCAAATLALRDGLAASRVVFFAPPLNPADYTTRFAEIVGITPEVVERMRERIEERFLRKWSDYSLAESARSMTARLLVVHDRGDTETFWSEGAGLAAAWPDAELISTENLGHRRILREPRLIEKTVQFIAAN